MNIVTHQSTNVMIQDGLALKLIPIRNRKKEIVAYTQVSDEDFDFLNQFRWRLHTGGYAVTGKNVLMHRLINRMATGQDSPTVDHRDLNPLNNQRDNLRSATHRQNSMNVRRRKSNTSGATGVSRNKLKGAWQISVGGVHRGYRKRKKDAIALRDEIARREYGEFYRPSDESTDE